MVHDVVIDILTSKPPIDDHIVKWTVSCTMFNFSLGFLAWRDCIYCPTASYYILRSNKYIGLYWVIVHTVNS